MPPFTRLYDLVLFQDSTAIARLQRSAFSSLLGIDLGSENGVARELASNPEVVRKLHEYVNELTENTFFDQGNLLPPHVIIILFKDVLQVKLDEIIVECFANVNPENGIYVEPSKDENTFGRYFIYAPLDTVVARHSGLLLKYVIRVYFTVQEYLRGNVSLQPVFTSVA